MDNIKSLGTEQQNKASQNLDQKPVTEILDVINSQDATIANKVNAEIKTIAKVIEKILIKFKNNGRVIYIGAGTSGRIGVLDASEIPPTYGVSKNKILGLIAGGNKAVIDSIEGAEDNKEAAIADLKQINLTSNDTVIGIASSGRTPYVISGLQYAKQVGAYAVGLCMVKNSMLEKIADDTIAVATNPEIISGSTRMQAGTATKLVCNMISTTLMVKSNKVYGNLMIDLQVKNNKLLQRATNIIVKITGCSPELAKNTLLAAHKKCINAIVMIKRNVDFKQSELLLEKAGYNLRNIID